MTHTTARIGTSEIYDDMRVRLITADFEQGQKLKPENIREAYSCSANTVREVLMRLASIGLVSFEEQRGFRARRSSRERQNDLTQFRILLEQEGCALSVKNGDIEWEAQLAAAHNKLSHIEGRIKKTGEVKPVLRLWSAAEWEFHDTLISACGSNLLRETYRVIYDQFRQQLVTRGTNFGYCPTNITQHQQITDAALARDEPACRQYIHDHLSRNMFELHDKAMQPV